MDELELLKRIINFLLEYKKHSLPTLTRKFKLFETYINMILFTNAKEFQKIIIKKKNLNITSKIMHENCVIFINIIN